MRHGTWVVVADGKKALLLHNTGSAVEPDLQVLYKDVQVNPPTSAQGTERPGRNADPVYGKSAMENTDWHQIAEDKFAHTVAGWVNAAALEKEFETLVVVAPARTLGELRKHFHKETQSRIIQEVDKDLTRHTVAEIAKLLST